MNYAIIAAGEGSRLKAEGINTPKPLVQVNGEPLMARLLRIFCANEAKVIAVICNEDSPEVEQFLRQQQQSLREDHGVDLQIVVKSTPSSAHSLSLLADILGSDPFILTTVDTVFHEEWFSMYVKAFHCILLLGIDALMGVTDYCDDEKPLYVTCDVAERITGFHDEKPCGNYLISAGIYGLTAPALSVLDECLKRGQSRMRNFQRALIDHHLHVEAYRLNQVFDIDHASDIEKANQLFTTKQPALPRVAVLKREPIFSPGARDRDAALAEKIVGCLSRSYISASLYDSTDNLLNDSSVRCIVSMQRSNTALTQLSRLSEAGVPVLNTPGGVSMCGRRAEIYAALKAFGLPVPSEDGTDGVWLKNGDTWSIGSEDVVYCKTAAEVEQTRRQFLNRGIHTIVQQAHIEGQLLKCYGVADNFFHISSSLGVDLSSLSAKLLDFARSIGVPIFGADLILTPEGKAYIIDFNDFPSFATCQIEAAQAIASQVIKNIQTS